MFRERFVKGPNTVAPRVERMYSGGPVRQLDHFCEFSYIALANQRCGGCWRMKNAEQSNRTPKTSIQDKMGQTLSGPRFVWKGPVFV